jgi:pilus assembly protein CpaB
MALGFLHLTLVRTRPDNGMNRKQLLLTGLMVLLLGALLSHSFYYRLYRAAGPVTSGVDLVVAAHDLQAGRTVTDEDIKIAKFQTSDVPSHSFHDKSTVVGRPLFLLIAKGDPLLPSDLGRSGDPVELLGITMRALSIRPTAVVGVANSVQVGTRVDVLLIRTSHRDGKEQSTTLLKDVIVIATGQDVEGNLKGDMHMVPTVTLLLSTNDALKLASASLKGPSPLLLRTR